MSRMEVGHACASHIISGVTFSYMHWFSFHGAVASFGSSHVKDWTRVHVSLKHKSKLPVLSMNDDIRKSGSGGIDTQWAERRRATLCHGGCERRGEITGPPSFYSCKDKTVVTLFSQVGKPWLEVEQCLIGLVIISKSLQDTMVTLANYLRVSHKPTCQVSSSKHDAQEKYSKERDLIRHFWQLKVLEISTHL